MLESPEASDNLIMYLEGMRAPYFADQERA